VFTGPIPGSDAGTGEATLERLPHYNQEHCLHKSHRKKIAHLWGVFGQMDKVWFIAVFSRMPTKCLQDHVFAYISLTPAPKLMRLENL